MPRSVLTIALHEKRPGTFEMTLGGRLDTETSPQLIERTTMLGGRIVRALNLELGNLDYISSMGLRAVLALMRQVTQGGGAFSMSNPRQHISKVFEIANVLPAEQIFTSVEEADRYLDMIQRKNR
jgi:anti-anti-sigma factor